MTMKQYAEALNIKGTFNSEDIPNEQLAQAYKFSPLQRAAIQNIIAGCAEEAIQAQLSEDSNSIPAIKKAAFMAGGIAQLQYLLSLEDYLTPPKQEGNQS